MFIVWTPFLHIMVVLVCGSILVGSDNMVSGKTRGEGLGMTGGWEVGWEGVLRVRVVLTFPP